MPDKVFYFYHKLGTSSTKVKCFEYTGYDVPPGLIQVIDYIDNGVFNILVAQTKHWIGKGYTLDIMAVSALDFFNESNFIEGDIDGSDLNTYSRL